MRLLWDGEWEYMARAGTGGEFFFGKDISQLPRFANCGGEDDGFADLAPVRSLEPNPWGFFDVYGNVWEWVDTSPLENEEKPRRGGSFQVKRKSCSSLSDPHSPRTSHEESYGLRVAYEP